MLRSAQLLYLMLPAYAANMAAPFSQHWPHPARLISARWLGSHKTWLGVGLAVAASTAVAWMQRQLAWRHDLLSDSRWFVFGPVCGAAAMLGDSAKSYFTRQLGMVPGRRWVPADQIDVVVAGLLALSWWVAFSWTDVVIVLGASFAGSIAVNRLSYRLSVKDPLGERAIGQATRQPAVPIDGDGCQPRTRSHLPTKPGIAAITARWASCLRFVVDARDPPCRSRAV